MSTAPRQDFDPHRYPRTAAYIAQLPASLDSFPECRGKVSIHRTVYAHADESLHQLPPELQIHLDGSSPSRRWIPQCHTLALILAIVESRGLGPEDEAQWIRGAASLLFSSPLYNILMWAASPRLLFKGADIRWSAFFRGSHLQTIVDDYEAELELRAPPGLFNEDLGRVFTDVLRAATRYTEHDSDAVRIEYASFERGCVRYTASW
jgi:hypothetical protein